VAVASVAGGTLGFCVCHRSVEGNRLDPDVDEVLPVAAPLLVGLLGALLEDDDPGSPALAENLRDDLRLLRGLRLSAVFGVGHCPEGVESDLLAVLRFDPLDLEDLSRNHPILLSARLDNSVHGRYRIANPGGALQPAPDGGQRAASRRARD